jgi:hypothetical protein
MKTAIIFADGIKQIILTPENDDERMALKLITVNDDISLGVVTGSFGDESLRPFSSNILECRGGYLRPFGEQNSIMLVLKPKDDEGK